MSATTALTALSGAAGERRDCDDVTWRDGAAVPDRRPSRARSTRGPNLNAVPAATPTNSPAAAATAIHRDAIRLTRLRTMGPVPLDEAADAVARPGNVMTRAARPTSSRRRAISDCCARRRSGGKSALTSASASSLRPDRNEPSSAYRLEHGAQSARCSADGGSSASPRRAA